MRICVRRNILRKSVLRVIAHTEWLIIMPMLHVYIYMNIIQQFSLIYVVFESTLLNYANPCRNWNFQRFARAAQQKGRNGTNEKSDTR